MFSDDDDDVDDASICDDNVVQYVNLIRLIKRSERYKRNTSSTAVITV